MTLKVKTSKFDSFTRSRTLQAPIQTASDLIKIGTDLFEKNFEQLDSSIRLLGISLGKFEDSTDPTNCIKKFFQHKGTLGT